jgi:hypothetical protein
MIVNVFFLAAASDSIVHGLKNLLRPLALALRPSGVLLKSFVDWIGAHAHLPRD